MVKCDICKQNLGNEFKEPIQVQIGNKMETRYIHRRVCKKGD